MRTWFTGDHHRSRTPAWSTKGNNSRAACPTLGEVTAERFLVRAETRSGDTWIELVHDRFVEPIRESNRAWSDRNQNPLTQAALRGMLPAGIRPGCTLAPSCPWLRSTCGINRANDGALEQAFVKEGEEAESLRTARRQRLILWTAVILSVVFVSLAVWGLWSASQAGLSERQAYQQKERADAEAGRANREAVLAQAASKAAEEQRITAVEAQQRAEVAGKAAAADANQLLPSRPIWPLC